MSEQKPQKPSQLSEEEIRELTDSAQNDPINLKESAKSSQEKTVSRPSRWREVKSIAARFLGRVARDEVIATVATGPAAPVVDGGVLLYDTYQFGKELHHYLKEEGAIIRASKKLTGNEKPLDEILKETRLAELAEAEKNHSKIYKNVVKNAVKDKSHSLDDTKLNQAKIRIDELSTPSLHERIATNAKEPERRIQMTRLLDEAKESSDTFRKNYLTGTPDQKYQYLLHESVKEFGKHHYDPLFNPEAGLRFDKFAAERVYIDGATKIQAEKAVLDKSPFSNVAGKDQYLRNTSSSLYGHSREAFEESGKLDAAKRKLESWRLTNHPSAFELKGKELKLTDHRTPVELKEAEKMIVDERKQQIYEVFSRYQHNPHVMPSTTEELQIEAGRRFYVNRWKGTLSKEHEEEMGLYLKLVGHDSEKLTEALDKVNTSSVLDKRFGSKTMEAVELKMSTPAYQNIQKDIQTIRIEQNMPNETRLDRFGIDTKLSGIAVEKSIDISRNAPDKQYKR